MDPINSFDNLRNGLRGAADATLYSSIRNYFSARIEYFMEYTLSNNISLALTMVGALFTLWIMVQGYLILTGRSQDSLKTFVFNIGKTYIIILVALGVSSTSEFALRKLTEVTTDGVASMMLGENEEETSKDMSECLTKATNSVLGCQIDQNLITAQAVMAFINQIDTADNARLADQVEQAKLFAGVGAAGPGIVTGTMLLLYRVAMALFIGFSPFFILCLMFKKTTPYFTKWLNYGLATIFSSVLLAAMAGICTDLVEIIAKRQFASNLVFTVLGINNSGVFNSAMNQLGLGLMMSTVLILVPPMAGVWFNGVMASTYGTNHFERWNNSSGGTAPIGSGAGSGAHGLPAYGNQQQSVNFQNNQHINQQPTNLQSLYSRHMGQTNTGTQSPPTTPTGLAVGAGRQPQQTEPTNQNNGRNSNGQA